MLIETLEDRMRLVAGRKLKGDEQISVVVTDCLVRVIRTSVDLMSTFSIGKKPAKDVSEKLLSMFDDALLSLHVLDLTPPTELQDILDMVEEHEDVVQQDLVLSNCTICCGASHALLCYHEYGQEGSPEFAEGVFDILCGVVMGAERLGVDIESLVLSR